MPCQQRSKYTRTLQPILFVCVCVIAQTDHQNLILSSSITTALPFALLPNVCVPHTACRLAFDQRAATPHAIGTKVYGNNIAAGEVMAKLLQGASKLGELHFSS